MGSAVEVQGELVHERLKLRHVALCVEPEGDPVRKVLALVVPHLLRASPCRLVAQTRALRLRCHRAEP